MSKWSPQNDEPALTLAAIRWYAVSLEKLATDLYITNREMYPDVKAVLSTAFKELGRLRGYCVPDAANSETSKTGMSKGKQRWPAGGWADKLQAESYASAGTPAPKPMSLSAEAADGCAPGYVDCNGVCLPECDNVAEY